MSDNTLATDIILGIEEAMRDAGWGLVLRSVEYAQVDPDNPGAATSETTVDTDFDGLVFDFDEKYLPGTTVVEGDKMVLVSVEGMTVDKIASIKAGNYIIDGSEIYSIIKTAPIRVAVATVVVIAQVKG